MHLLEVLVPFQPEDINLIKTTTGAKTLADLKVLQAEDWDKVELPLVPKRKLRNFIEVQGWIFIFTALRRVVFNLHFY